MLLHKKEISFLVEGIPGLMLGLSPQDQGNEWSFMGTFTLGCFAQKQGLCVHPKPAESVAWNGTQLTLDRRGKKCETVEYLLCLRGTNIAAGESDAEQTTSRLTRSLVSGACILQICRVNGCLLPFPW